MADCQVAHIDLDSTFGAQYWGLLVSIFFLGAAVVQAYIYYMSNPDGWFTRAFVTVVLVLDVAVTVLVSDAMHFYLITSSGNPAGLVQMTQSFVAEIVLSITIVVLSQYFYASRVLMAGKNNTYARIAAAIISVGSFTSFGLGLAGCINLYISGRDFVSLTLTNYKSMVSAYSFINGLCDAMATFSMCHFLSSYKSAFKSTTSVVNSLFLFSINRGFLVFVAQIGFVTVYLIAPSKGYWTPFHLVLPKLHVNTLLAMLNSRANLRSRMEGRVYFTEGSNPRSVPIKWLTVATAGQSVGNTKSDDEIIADVPEHGGVNVTRSFTTPADDDGGAVEASGSAKGWSIA